MSKEFSTLMGYLGEMHARYLDALAVFSVYESLRELRAPNHIGQEESDKNAEMMSMFRHFFKPVEEATLRWAALELAKIFDGHRDSVAIPSVLRYIEGNGRHLTREDFREFNPGRPYLENLYEHYEGVQKVDIEKIRKWMDDHKDLLEKFKEFRDSHLAHSDKKRTSVTITFDEVRALLAFAEETLNFLSDKLNSSQTLYSSVKRDAFNDTKSLLDHLLRFEPYRMKEIQEEFENRNRSATKKLGDETE